MIFNATFQQYFSYIVVVSFIGGANHTIFQLYRGGQQQYFSYIVAVSFYWWRKPGSTIFQLYRGDQIYWLRKPE